jgi:hypothetical protein
VQTQTGDHPQNSYILTPNTGTDVALRNRLTIVVRYTAGISLIVAGAALVAGAFAANQRWLDRHFLPSFLMTRASYVRIETGVRLMFAIGGLALVLAARPAARRLTLAALGYALGIAIAIGLALGVSELVLRKFYARASEWRAIDEEPRRRPDARLGWSFVPGRTGFNQSGGRRIAYTFDAAGYRVRSADRPVDIRQPSLLFAGESVMFGDGLTYDESIPAQVEAMLGVQSVNLAVYGYSTDQAFLRLAAELPEFRKPEAVVLLFMTALFGRNLDDDRPHLRPGLEWEPAATHGRLIWLAQLLVPFRREITVDRGVLVTRETLGATADLARARGAVPLIVVPHFGPESDAESALRHRIFDGASLPVVTVEMDPSWHIQWDRHPDARAAHLVAAAIAQALRNR